METPNKGQPSIAELEARVADLEKLVSELRTQQAGFELVLDLMTGRDRNGHSEEGSATELDKFLGKGK